MDTTGYAGESAPAPPRHSRWRARLLSPTGRTWWVYLPLCTVSAALAASTWDLRTGGVEGSASGAAILIFLLGIGLGVALRWRRRYPAGVVVVAAVATLLVPIDPVAALIALGSLLVRRLDRMAMALVGFVTVATYLSVWRDGRGTTQDESFWQMLRGSGQPGEVLSPLTWWVVLLITLALVAAACATAMIVRERQSSRVHDEQRAVVATLTDEVARQAERERIAQEVHDALGHRLSLLSLHAGALEMQSAGKDPRLVESATLIREAAEQSMNDLRSLLVMLRRPDSADVAAAVPTLDDVPALIDDTVSTGGPLVSTVQFNGLNLLDTATSRGAYRIVQELLTNARKHAPGIGVRVIVTATPGVGVDIETANHVPDPPAHEANGSGSGLTGIRTRAEELSGDVRVWTDDQRVFRVAVHLPWRWAAEAGVNVPSPTGENE